MISNINALLQIIDILLIAVFVAIFVSFSLLTQETQSCTGGWLMKCERVYLRFAADMSIFILALFFYVR